MSETPAPKPLIEYPFPEGAQLELQGYNVFPRELEDDPHVFFHATAARILPEILEDGLKSAKALGNSDGLDSVSFARKSMGALTHWMTGKDVAGDAVILAVCFDDVTNFVGDGIAVYRYGDFKQPQIIGICRFPANYRHV